MTTPDHGLRFVATRLEGVSESVDALQLRRPKVSWFHRPPLVMTERMKIRNALGLRGVIGKMGFSLDTAFEILRRCDEPVTADPYYLHMLHERVDYVSFALMDMSRIMVPKAGLISTAQAGALRTSLADAGASLRELGGAVPSQFHSLPNESLPYTFDARGWEVLLEKLRKSSISLAMAGRDMDIAALKRK